MKFDLNCDLGEGEPLQRTRALMKHVTSANVACGGHAGSVQSMVRCVELARDHGVRLGAHPGLWDRDNFGRKHIHLTAHALESLLLHQVGALEKLARHKKANLHHVKLHGALYHATEQEEKLGRAYVDIVARWWPRLKIYALAQGKVARWARQAGLKVWEEAFVDRSYRTDGNLVPRHEPGAVLTDLRHVQARLRLLAKSGQILSQEGTPMRLKAQTLCLHSDTRNSLKIARLFRQSSGS